MRGGHHYPTLEAHGLHAVLESRRRYQPCFRYVPTGTQQAGDGGVGEGRAGQPPVLTEQDFAVSEVGAYGLGEVNYKVEVVGYTWDEPYAVGAEEPLLRSSQGLTIQVRRDKTFLFSNIS